MLSYRLLSLSVLFFSNSYAGDAGYYAMTCYSQSKRTVVTLFEDYGASVHGQEILTLIVDGMTNIYDSNRSHIQIERTGDVDYDVIVNGNLAVRLEGSNVTVYHDPRLGTVAMHGATQTPWSSNLECSLFFPDP